MRRLAASSGENPRSRKTLPDECCAFFFIFLRKIGTMLILAILFELTYASRIRSSYVEHMNLPPFYRKQHAIATDYHLTNLFGELVVFGREGETFRHDSELFENRCSELAGPLLCFALAPVTTAPFIRPSHVCLCRVLKDHYISLHSSSAMPFSAKNSRKNSAAGLPALFFMLRSPRFIPSMASILSFASNNCW